MWKEDVLVDQKGYRLIDGIYSRGEVIGNSNVDKMLLAPGTDFHSRVRVPGSQSYFDCAVVYHYLERLFKGFSAKTVLDVGCGDGRVTTWLLENTAANIVAVDCSLDSLRRLQRRYLAQSEGYERRVLLLQCNVVDIPLRENSCDFVWAFESLYYLLEDYQRGINELSRILTDQGLLANCDRDYEYGLIYELLNKGPEALLAADKTKLMPEPGEEGDLQARLLTRREIRQALKANELYVMAESPVPAISVMVSYLNSRGLFVDEIQRYSAEMVSLFLKLLPETAFCKSTIFWSSKSQRGAPF
ncbi:methyltransferase family protein [Sinobacterium caligoides]|uniref:Methyltransferase family protein n=1 Tax=Sinobacterium caligoides TaxID=933926 RepID=A0A3N2DL83_9GAMM|nr:class I SAM-dependent methyltransferase [Sinobacterium caligoides]ROS00115.1 methyltransferase family protein [Sinobacterium caligoides]